MQSIDLLRLNLASSARRVLLRVEDMRDHAFTPSTPNGGPHTLWVLGHLAYIEGLVVHHFALGRDNPFAHWEHPFDGDSVPTDPAEFPPFDDVLAACRQARRDTIAQLHALTEEHLDRPAPNAPKGHEDDFGTVRHCFQYAADHWHMHRGQLADARRAASIDRMWL